MLLFRRFVPGPVLFLIMIHMVSGCATNPVSGKKEIVLMSEDDELKLGQRYDPEIRKQYGVYHDPKLQAYINRIGQRLAAQSHRPGLRYRFTVLDSPEVNAFALPGGHIYITRGIMAYLNSEAELAAVLGHEIGHVTARHGVQQYTAATAANIGVTIASIFVPELANTAGQQLLDIIGGALLSGYGREHELEADRLGAEYLARTGYDSKAVTGVIAVLKNQEEYEINQAKAEGRKPRVYHGVFASHPSADKRLQEVVGEAEKYKTTTTTRVARSEYLSHVDGLTFGNSTRMGVLVGHSLYNREPGFVLRFPEKWRFSQQPDTVIASEPARKAILQLAIQDIKTTNTPEAFIRQRLKLKRIEQQGKLVGTKLPGYTVVAPIATPYGKRDARVTVVYFNNKAFIFFGASKNNNDLAAYDPLFLGAARSLRSIKQQERRLAQGRSIDIIRNDRGETFAQLAKRSTLRRNPEAVLRLINNMYPSGEPAPGAELKIVR